MTVNRISSQQAVELADQGVAYLDVRSVPEFEAGHAPGAYNIPLLHLSGGAMQPNPAFETEVQAAFPRDTPLLVGCKAGSRSATAATVLDRLGYTTLYDIAGGFAGSNDDRGWTASGGASTTAAEPGRTYAALKK
jgi:rhodanese-related sulfurtransferase